MDMDIGFFLFADNFEWIWIVVVYHIWTKIVDVFLPLDMVNGYFTSLDAIFLPIGILEILITKT